MDKQQFFKELKFALRRSEYSDVQAVIDYYDEIIMERRERGESEESIIASFDSADKIAGNMEKEMHKIEKKQKAREATRTAVEEPGAKNFGKALVTVFALPITVPLMIVLVMLVIALVITTFSLIVALWAVCIGLVAVGAAVFVSGIILGITASSWMMVFAGIGAGLIIFAIGLAMLNGAVAMTKGMFKGSAKILMGTVRLFTGKKKVK